MAGSSVEFQDLQLELSVSAPNAVSLTTSDGYTFVVLENGTVQLASPSDALWETASIGFEFAKYTLTEDEALQSKTYYTKSGTSPNVVYTAVAEPNVGNIGTYYERTSASAGEISALPDAVINVWAVGGTRTRVIETAPVGDTQANFAASGFATCGLASNVPLSITIDDGAAVWTGGTADPVNVYYSICGEATEVDKDDVEEMAVGAHRNDGNAGGSINGNSLTATFTDPTH